MKQEQSSGYNISPDNLKEELLKKERELIALIEHYKGNLKNKPQGKLKITKNNSGVHYYWQNEKGSEYIHRSDEAIVWKLAQKSYDELVIGEAERELKLIRNMMKKYQMEKLQMIWQQMCDNRKQIITDHILTDEEYVQNWISRKYERKSFDENDTTEFYTARGERVRSKSEVMIADTLYRYHIPYCYEAPTEVKGYARPIYPDFTCLNIRKRKEIIWEHLGMLGREDYADANVRKLEKYLQSGYYQGDNLIMTMETTNVPLSTRTIEQMIKKYLL